jgi:hypothetical protein
MNKTTQHLAIGLGVIAAGHYMVSPYFSSAAADSPPLASITALSTGTGTASYSHATADTITDAEYAGAKPAAGLTVTVFRKV